MTHIFAYENGKGGFFNINTEVQDRNAFSGITKYSNHQDHQKEFSGPVPVGLYTISKVENNIAFIEINDEEAELYGRDNFHVHTSDISDHTSQGCIIVSKEAFEKIKKNDSLIVTNEMSELPEIEIEEENEEENDNENEDEDENKDKNKVENKTKTIKK